MEEINLWELKFDPCYYSNRLLNKIIELNKKSGNKINITEVKKAIYYAKKYHGEQKRDSGEPYYSHPLEVAYMISDYLFRTDIIVTSILHDTIEDTDLTFEMVKAIFNEIIANQVMDLTRIKENGRKISAAEMLESLWFQQKYDALLIKLFDRLHNMQTIGAKSPEKIRKVIEETFELFLVLSVYFQTHKIEKELIQLCCNYLDIKPGARSISFSDEFFSG